MEKISNLSDLRKSKGLKACYIANILGISRQSLRNKEKMKTPVTCLEARTMANEFNVPIEMIAELCRLK